MSIWNTVFGRKDPIPPKQKIKKSIEVGKLTATIIDADGSILTQEFLGDYWVDMKMHLAADDRFRKWIDRFELSVRNSSGLQFYIPHSRVKCIQVVKTPHAIEVETED